MILTSLLLSLAAFAQGSDLRFEATGLETDSGHVLCTLYNTADSWLQDPGWFATATATPSSGTATCVFKNVPPGTYAITFLHDVNDNGDMDSNFLGLPREPWGMSRNPSVLFGAPTFEKAAFTHPSPEPQTAPAH